MKSRSGKGVVLVKQEKRQVNRWRSRHVKLRSVVGVVERKSDLKCALLNVDGLTLSSLEDIRGVLELKKPDLCIILETKRMEGEVGLEARIDGYSLTEIRRSDTANDRHGGGIAYYTRQVDGLVVHEHKPDIVDPGCHFVNKERVWLKTESTTNKTAICAAYFGCQTPDNRHADWNSGMYKTVHEEEASLRAQGYRILMLADFNAHIGSKKDEGIEGNHPDVNKNGRQLLDFLHSTRMKHVNGQKNLTKGLWTRQRGNSRTIIDYVLISEEHLHTVKSLEIDDKGVYPGGSDHNWLFLSVTDNFVKKKRLMNTQVRKPKWLLGEVEDWTPFQECVREKIAMVETGDITEELLAGVISSSLLSAGERTIGLTSGGATKKGKPSKYPRHVIEEIERKREMERGWKTAVSNGEGGHEELEAKFLEQKRKLEEIMGEFSNRDRGRILFECSGNSPQSRRCFWNKVSRKVKEQQDLSAVVDPDDKKLKCTKEEIKEQVEKHYCRTFLGSMEPVESQNEENIPHYRDGADLERNYSVSPMPRLPKVNESQTLEEDPGGWMNKNYSLEEVRRALKLLQGGRARGWDNIPNEFLMNAPEELLSLIVVLFNKIQQSGKVSCLTKSNSQGKFQRDGIKE